MAKVLMTMMYISISTVQSYTLLYVGDWTGLLTDHVIAKERKTVSQHCIAQRKKYKIRNVNRKQPLGRTVHAVLYGELQCSLSSPDVPVCRATDLPLQCSASLTSLVKVKIQDTFTEKV